MLKVTALRSYAKLGVNFDICDRALVVEEIVNQLPTSFGNLFMAYLATMEAS